MPSPSTARTINLCSYSKKDKGYTLGDEIYTTTEDQSQSWLNYLNCGKKIDEALESSIYIYIYITQDWLEIAALS